MNPSTLDTIKTKYQGAQRDALIPMLQEIQQAQGYLSEESIRDVGRLLKLPLSKIYGVASFYNQFRFAPIGKYHLLICRGTACHVKGSVALLHALQHELKIEPGQTTRDGLFTLDVVACIGACGLAPVVCVNGEFHAKMTPEKVAALISTLRSENKNDN